MRRGKGCKRSQCRHVLFQRGLSPENLPKLSNQNAQNEYYITDLIGMAVESGAGAGAFAVNPMKSWGSTTEYSFPEARSRVMRRRIAERHMTAGVTIVDPESVYIEEDVVIGNDTEIWPGAELKGRTIIGNGCVIGRDTIIEDSTIGDRTDILEIGY